MPEFTVLPPSKGCPICAVDHPPEQPHDATSFYYQVGFASQNNRSATWNDALAHCSDEVRQKWVAHLTKIGIDINSLNVKGDIKSNEELERRLGTDN